MFRNKQRDDELDILVDDVVRSGGVGENESDGLASSPLLFEKVRQRIARDGNASDTVEGDYAIAAGWMLTLLVARRAIPALALLAMVSIVALWLASKNQTTSSGASTGPGDPALAVRLVATGGTCALSNTAECAISNEEVLATMFGDGEVPK